MINEQLLTFIEQQLLKGLDKETITKELLSGGWNAEDIAEGFNTINIKIPNPVNREAVVNGVVNSSVVDPVVKSNIPSDIINVSLTPEKKTSSKKIVLVIISVLVLVGLVTIYLFRNDIPIIKGLIKSGSVLATEIGQRNDNTQSQLNKEETTAPTPTQTEQIDASSVTNNDQTPEPVIKKDTVATVQPKIPTSIGVIDCGTDSSCFINAANTCQKTKVVLNQKAALVFEIGSVDYSQNIEITGKEGDNCIFRAKFTDYKFKYSDYGISGMLEQGSTLEDIKKSEASMGESIIGSGQICKVDSSKKVGDAISNFMMAPASGDIDVSCENSVCSYKDSITCESFAKLNDDPNCTLDANMLSFDMYKGVSSSVSVSGFKGKESQISWSVKDSNIVGISSTTGSSIMVKSLNVGSTELVVTDNAVGKSCSDTIPVEITKSEYID